MEKRIIFFIRYAPVTILPLVVATIFYLIISGYKESLHNNIELYKNSLLEQEKSQVKTNVELAIQIYKNQIFLTADKERHNNTFLNLLKNINNKTSDYYFIFDINGNVIIHSFLNSLEGKNLFIIEDENYNKVIKLITTNYKEERFLKYLWLNPNTNIQEEKISFVKQIPETNFILGSGFYLSSIEDRALTKKISEESNYDNNIYMTIFLAFVFIILTIFISFIISHILLKKFDSLVKEKNILERESFFDPLTNLYNRNWFLKALDNSLKKLKDEKIIFSLIIFDIDDIKKINTNFSYDFGDIIIKEIADLIKASIPKNAILSRIAGDRFAILLPNLNLQDSFTLSKKLKNNCEGRIFDKIERVTISLGVIEATIESSSHEIIRKVDLALFKAKKEGKNRVVAFKS